MNENKIGKMITVYNKSDLNPYVNTSKNINVISASTGHGINRFKKLLSNHI